jgi:hypothetical protein
VLIESGGRSGAECVVSWPMKVAVIGRVGKIVFFGAFALSSGLRIDS